MKRLLFATLCLATACNNLVPEIEGKQIYIPNDLQNNLAPASISDTCTWSYQRMQLTENFAIFWQKGFGDNLQSPPELDSTDMSVDMENLKRKLEYFYKYYRDSLTFIKPGSLADTLRMLVMLNYSLEGTAYGGDYDHTIGAFWVAPNRIKDTALNCVAHELGHSFQMQCQSDNKHLANIPDDDYQEWEGGPFYEMTSQWMLWHVNPYWQRDEKYHWDAYRKQTHHAFLSWTNAYHTPYVLEWWSERRGHKIIGRIFQEAKHREDPVDVYKRLTGISQDEFADEIFLANAHTLYLDFSHAFAETRPYIAEDFSTKFINDGNWLRVSPESCPENYGYNAIEIPKAKIGTNIKVDFEGLAEKYLNDDTYAVRSAEIQDFRIGFVGKCEESFVYSPIFRPGNAIEYNTKDLGLSKLWLIVMPAPKVHVHNPENPELEKNMQWPYRIRF